MEAIMSEKTENAVNEKLIKMAEALGIDTKGKDNDELTDLVTKAWDNEKVSIAENKKQVYFDNGSKKVPELKKQFEKPFEVYVEKIQNGKKPECQPVVGYNPKTSSVILYKEVTSEDGKVTGKLFQVDEKLVIKSAKQFTDLEQRLKAERAANKTASKKST